MKRYSLMRLNRYAAIGFPGILLGYGGVVVSLSELGSLLGWKTKNIRNPNYIKYLKLFRVLVILLIASGFVSAYNDRLFDVTSYVLNIFRVLICYTLFRQILFARAQSLHFVRKAFSFALWVSSIALLLDVFVLVPLDWTEYTIISFDASFSRPRGIFGEPSFAVLFISLTYLSLSELWYSKITFILVLTALMLSTSIIGYLCAAFVIFTFSSTLTKDKRLFLYLGFLIFIIIIYYLGVYDYALARFLNYESDGSMKGRLIGSSLSLYYLYLESLWMGVGLGGGNAGPFLQAQAGLEFLMSAGDRICYLKGECDPLVYAGTTTFWSNIALAGGVPSLILLFLILLKSSQTKTFLLFILFYSLAKGQIFEPHFWMLLAMQIILNRKIVRGESKG